LEFLARAIKQEETKVIQIGKKVVKVYIFADNMILYMKDSKNSTKNLQDPMYSFSKVTGSKINLQISIAFQCTKNEQIEKEHGKIIPLQ
jgi:hypothetical protein